MNKKYKYIGEAHITKLGSTEKLGAFLTIDIKELLSGIENILDNDENAKTVHLKVLEKKTNPNIHNVKLIL